MKMKFSKMILAISMGSVTLISCDKDDDVVSPPLSAKTVQDIPADTANTGHFTFFSLDDSSIVALSDSATAKWDIGFRGTTIIVNGGTSGPGAGGAFIYNGLFSGLTTVPADSVFKQDNGSSFAINGWYTYTGTSSVPNHAILPVAGKVIVLRTADNKYAKIEILSYYKGNPNTTTAEFADVATRPKSRFYTIKYVYQPDGSKQLN